MNCVQYFIDWHFHQGQLNGTVELQEDGHEVSSHVLEGVKSFGLGIYVIIEKYKVQFMYISMK